MLLISKKLEKRRRKRQTNLMGISVLLESVGSSDGHSRDNERIGTPHHNREPSSKQSLRECVDARNKQQIVDDFSLLYLFINNITEAFESTEIVNMN